MERLFIGFLLGSPSINGGTYVIYEHATRLKRNGHRVVVITREEVEAGEYAWHSSAHELEWLTIDQAETEHFDLVLATWWQSPFLLHKFPAKHYIYFVQSIETRFFLPSDPLDYGSQDDKIWQQLCEKTYSYNLPIITEAEWIQDYIFTTYNNYPWLVRNGIRKDIYTVDGDVIAPRREKIFRVLVEGPVDVAYKNVPTSIQLARQAGADEIWLLTSSDVTQYKDVDRVFSRVPIHETPAIYRSCDLLLKLSYVEGMFGPPLEMFHCGGTALVYAVTGHDEYIVHDSNSFVVARDDEEQVISLLRKLKQEPGELKRLKQGARETAAQWPGWRECSGEFEKVLLAIAATRPVSRQYFKRYTEELFAIPKPLGKARLQDVFAARERAVWKGQSTDKKNFIEFYWHHGEEFNKDNYCWQHYHSEEWVTAVFEAEVNGFPFWLRLDPSIWIGILDIEFIKVRNLTQQLEIMSFMEPEEFHVLFLGGDAKWIFPEQKNIVFSYGTDPILLLPAIVEGDAAIGERIEISIKLRETGIQQFFREYTLKHRQEQLLVPDPAPPTPWYRKVAAKIAGR
jgi:glycosyltransferase involved in cell wall biosynthesis